MQLSEPRRRNPECESRQLVEVIRRKRESPIPLPQTQSVFVRVHNKALSVVAVRVNIPDRSTLRINS